MPSSSPSRCTSHAVANTLTQQTAAAAAADTAGADEPAPGEGRKKKKLKTKHAAAAIAAAAAADDDGISLFSRQPAGGPGTDAAAAFVDREAQVQTRDPYEEANVVRKAHRIKASQLADCKQDLIKSRVVRGSCSGSLGASDCGKLGWVTMNLSERAFACRYLAARPHRHFAALQSWTQSLGAAAAC
jgi:pyruvate/2-oxoglutarate dehydrogenase complex dihydrolipoamide acyltransferase (E2) component